MTLSRAKRKTLLQGPAAGTRVRGRTRRVNKKGTAAHPLPALPCNARVPNGREELSVAKPSPHWTTARLSWPPSGALPRWGKGDGRTDGRRQRLPPLQGPRRFPTRGGDALPGAGSSNNGATATSAVPDWVATRPGRGQRTGSRSGGSRRAPPRRSPARPGEERGCPPWGPQRYRPPPYLRGRRRSRLLGRRQAAPALHFNPVRGPELLQHRQPHQPPPLLRHPSARRLPRPLAPRLPQPPLRPRSAPSQPPGPARPGPALRRRLPPGSNPAPYPARASDWAA